MHLGNKTLKPLFESKAMFMSFTEEWVRFEEVALYWLTGYIVFISEVDDYNNKVLLSLLVAYAFSLFKCFIVLH